MALAGPHLVKAAVGEDVSAEDMGGSKVHNKISGVADLEVPDDESCLSAVRKYLSFFPSSNLDKPPLHEVADPVDRLRVRQPAASRAARAAVASIVEAGWFRPQQSLVYDFVLHFVSVDQWLRHREERRATAARRRWSRRCVASTTPASRSATWGCAGRPSMRSSST